MFVDTSETLAICWAIFAEEYREREPWSRGATTITEISALPRRQEGMRKKFKTAPPWLSWVSREGKWNMVRLSNSDIISFNNKIECRDLCSASFQTWPTSKGCQDLSLWNPYRFYFHQASLLRFSVSANFSRADIKLIFCIFLGPFLKISATFATF